MAVVGDPTALRELFALPTSQFRWGHRFNVLGFVVGERSLIVSDGEDHRRRRGAVQAGFTRRRLNRWIPMIVERTDAAIDALELAPDGSTREVDLAPTVRAIVLDVVVRSLFGASLADRTTEIGALFQGPQDYLESPAVRQIPHRIPGTTRARVRDDRRALDAIIDDQIAAHRAHPGDDPLDLLAALVDDGTPGRRRDPRPGGHADGRRLRHDGGLALLDGLVRVARARAVGIDSETRPTPSSVLPAGASRPTRPRWPGSTWPDAPCGRRPASTRRGSSPHGRPPSTWSSAATGSRRAPWSCGRPTSPAATLAAWTDPLRFDPDRHLDPTAEQDALATAAWVPFGRGARSCLGFALAQMELTLIISRLAQRLDVEATSATMPHPVGMVVNRPAGGAPMRVAAHPPPGPGRRPARPDPGGGPA